MLGLFRSQDRRRLRALAKARHPVMQSFLSQPFPREQDDWRSAQIVSLDFETTGLDPERDRLLSYGCIEIDRGTIRFGSAAHEIIRSNVLVPEASAVIHHITDDTARAGRPLQEVLPLLLERLRGKLLLVHFKRVEIGFLDAICRALYGSPFLIPTIDTLELAQRVLKPQDDRAGASQLRLFNLRDRYGLPKYSAHDALYDAMTTAELLLVLAAELSPKKSLCIGDLISRK